MEVCPLLAVRNNPFSLSDPVSFLALRYAITLSTDFDTFLHRNPTAAETTALVNSTADLLSVEAIVLSLPEYFTNG
jgi:hypothetical protein